MPCRFNSSFVVFDLSCNFSLNSGWSFTYLILVNAPAHSTGDKLVVKINALAKLLIASINSLFPAMYPPCTPNAFAKVPFIISTSILSLSHIPAP